MTLVSCTRHCAVGRQGNKQALDIIRITAQQLYDSCFSRLELEWLVQPDTDSVTIVPLPRGTEASSLIGHLNFIHPHRIQVLGPPEVGYLDGLGKNSHIDSLDQLFSDETALVILSQDQQPSDKMLQLAKERHIPMLSSAISSTKLIREIGFYLHNRLAESRIEHGVFMDVLGIGILLTGESAIGKSELALELLTRGHRLIADDAPMFIRTTPGTLVGHCPEVLHNFLEVRGLGILNVRAMFGDSAVKRSMELQLIVHLAPVDPELLQQLDRLKGTRRKRTILEVEVDEVEIPVAPGRNLAVLVEAAARNHLLYTSGYDSAMEFVSRQQELMQADDP
jgi:HPr kinase/phosphorylase